MKQFFFKSWFISTLRRASYRYPPRYGVLAAARAERGKYVCAHCDKVHARKDVQVDHVQPVIDPFIGFPKTKDGKEDWNTYIARMFCDASGFQVLCTTCHDAKTQEENTVRRVVKKVDKRTKRKVK